MKKQLDESFFGPRLTKPTQQADIPVIPPISCQGARVAYDQLRAGEEIGNGLKYLMAYHCQKKDHEASCPANDPAAKKAIEQTLTG